MYRILTFGNIELPTYGIIVICDVVVCSFIAAVIVRNKGLSIKQLIIIEFLGGVSAIAVSRGLAYFNKTIIKTYAGDAKKAGYDYFGGLLGFFLAIYLLKKTKKYDADAYAENLIFLIPLMYALWKVACIFGGCCIGIPYNGIGSITFPNGANELSGISVFPVQLLEIAESLIIMFCLIDLKSHNRFNIETRKSYVNPAGIYLFLYSLVRFFTEFLRYRRYTISESHVYAVICMIIALCILKNARKEVKKQSHG